MSILRRLWQPHQQPLTLVSAIALYLCCLAGGRAAEFPGPSLGVCRCCHLLETSQCQGLCSRLGAVPLVLLTAAWLPSWFPMSASIGWLSVWWLYWKCPVLVIASDCIQQQLGTVEGYVEQLSSNLNDGGCNKTPSPSPSTSSFDVPFCTLSKCPFWMTSITSSRNWQFTLIEIALQRSFLHTPWAM